jgi:hypothetical protein
MFSTERAEAKARTDFLDLNSMVTCIDSEADIKACESKSSVRNASQDVTQDVSGLSTLWLTSVPSGSNGYNP